MSLRTTTRPARLLTAVSLAAIMATGAAGCTRDERPTSSAEGETYQFEHEYGVTEIPVDYERVVVTHTAALDVAVTVGVVPVGATVDHTGFPGYLGIDESAMTEIGESDNEVDPEIISNLDPDLILMTIGPTTSIEDTYFDAYSAIAPTVPLLAGRQDPKGLAAQGAAALNREAELHTFAERYDARTTRLRALLQEVPEARLPVSQVRLRADHARVMFAETNSGVAITDAGLTFKERLPGVELDRGGYYETSLETLPEALGDYLFVFSTDEGVLENVQTLPIWQQIPAVQNGTDFEVNFETWMRGQGYLALDAIIDDIAGIYGVDLNDE